MPLPPRDPSVDKFIAHVHEVQKFAKLWAPGDLQRQNKLTMQWIRHVEYDNIGFKLLAGLLDSEWIRAVKVTQSFGMMPLYTDPMWNVDIRSAHTAVTCEIIVDNLANNRPLSHVQSDFGGWLGDLCTFYAEWQRDAKKEPDAFNYCKKFLASTTQESTFHMRDLIEDADAVNIAIKLNADKTLSFADALDAELKIGGGFLTRMSRFYLARFQSKQSKSFQAAEDGIMGSGDLLVPSLRMGAMIATYWLAEVPISRPGPVPPPIDSTKINLDNFCGGFSQRLADVVVEEKAKVP